MFGFIIVVLPVVLLPARCFRQRAGKYSVCRRKARRAVKLLTDAKSIWTVVYLGVFAVVIAPVAEEFIFRGMLFPFVKRLGFPKLAWFGVSFLFALIHLNAPTFVPLFALALALTWLYDRTDNLLAPITAHALFNAANLRRAALAKPSVARMNEFELIAKLTRALPTNESVMTGAGDDCAVLDLGVADKAGFVQDRCGG